MTWDHPRAYLALEAFGAHDTAPAVTWDRQPLADFEARPITELAAIYDFMIIDHPGLGDAIRTGALAPLEAVLGPEDADRYARSAVGESGASYRLAGGTWALPIDAAAQVAVRRPGVPVPRRWEDVPDLAEEQGVTLCLAGPHAGLSLLAMCSGNPPRDSQQLVEPAVAASALTLLRTVFGQSSGHVLDPIGVHELLVSGEGPSWCPLAYGYVSYRQTLEWSDAPTWRGDRPLSVLGGTGLAVSARSEDREDLRQWIRAFLNDKVQSCLVPKAGGQPALRRVWEYSPIFYRQTMKTLEAAWVRPRIPGWIPFQEHLSELVREVVVDGRDPELVVSEINARYGDVLAIAGHIERN